MPAPTKSRSLVEELVEQSTSPFEDLEMGPQARTDFELPSAPTGELLGGLPSEGGDRSIKTPEATPQKSAPTSSPDRGAIVSAITAAAKKHGVDPARLLAIAIHESSVKGQLDPNAVNPASGAKGLFQALPKWSKQYGLTGKEHDVAASSDAAARSLKESVGVKNPYVSYLIHNQGRKGAELIIKAALGQGELPPRIKRNMLAQPIFKGKNPAEADLAKAFLAQQRKRFMSHYEKAKAELGPIQQEEQLKASLPSSNIDWDGLISQATGEAQQAAGQLMASNMGPAMPRTTYGGKI